MAAGSGKRGFVWGPVIALVMLGTVAWNLLPSMSRQSEEPVPHFDGLSRSKAVFTAAAACDVDHPSAVHNAAWSLQLDALRPEEAKRHGGGGAASVWRVPKHAGMYVRLSAGPAPGEADEHSDATYCTVVAADVDHAKLLTLISAPDALGAPRKTSKLDSRSIYEWPPDKDGAATVRLHFADEPAMPRRDIELEFAFPMPG